MFEKARIAPAGTPVDFSLGFRSGDHAANFALRAGSSRNPFGQNLLKDFRCPTLRTP
ncbi:MAG: hypothetical protein WDN69_13595 [Aliidongia sp.]